MSPYETYQNKIGVRLSYLLKKSKRKERVEGHPSSIEVISYSAYEQRAYRNKDFRLRKGLGAGNEVLLSWKAIEPQWQKILIEKFGDPASSKNPLEAYFQIDAKARAFYEGANPDSFRFEDGTYLRPDQVDRYTINASVLNALQGLKNDRQTSRKMRGSSLRGLWPSLINDVKNFNDFLKANYNTKHTLPLTTKLKVKLKDYEGKNYSSLIDGRAKNQNAQVVTPLMLEIWRDIYAGQRNIKPDYTEVSRRYDAFCAGLIDVVMSETGELYNNQDKENFKPASRSTVYLHQSSWENAAPTHAKRSGDRQKFKQQYEPFHKLMHPEFAGSIISVDDRQPPFKTLAGNRIWFYNAIDLGSEAFTTWVHGNSKEGIILEFYRQMVRNYTAWGLNLPYELEGELSLNASYVDSFLSPGAMFSEVRIEANNARGKRIEAYYRPLRYQLEKKREGWLARPHAKSEANQMSDVKVPRLPQAEIVTGCLKDIETWNNMPHSNQDLHPGMSRWDVFLDKQHPELTATNWPAILSGLGYRTKSTMRAGRVILQGKHRVVGHNGEVALGTTLINILRQIEGQEVEVRWLDDVNGQVLKSLIYDKSGRMVCELLGDLAYHRASIERTPQCAINRELTSAYTATVQGYIATGKKAINNVTIIERPQPETKKRFVMPGISAYTAPKEDAPALPALSNGFEEGSNPIKTPVKTSTASRF